MGPSSTGWILRDLGTVLTSAASTPFGDSETQRLRSSGGGRGDWARVSASQCQFWEFLQRDSPPTPRGEELA